MNQMYGFEGEVKAKYTGQMFQLFSEVFQWLPLAQCINSKVLVRNMTYSTTDHTADNAASTNTLTEKHTLYRKKDTHSHTNGPTHTH